MFIIVSPLLPFHVFLLVSVNLKVVPTMKKTKNKNRTFTPVDISEGRTVHPLPAALSDRVVAAHPQGYTCGGVLYHTWQATTENLIQKSLWTERFLAAATTSSDNPVFKVVSHHMRD